MPHKIRELLRRIGRVKTFFVLENHFLYFNKSDKTLPFLCFNCDKIVIRLQSLTGNLTFPSTSNRQTLESDANTAILLRRKEDIFFPLTKLTPLSNRPHHIVEIGAAQNQNKRAKIFCERLRANFAEKGQIFGENKGDEFSLRRTNFCDKRKAKFWILTTLL